MQTGLQHGPAAVLRELSGGVVAGGVALAYAFSYAALLLPTGLRDLLPLAVGLALINAAVGSAWLSLRSQMPFALSGPDGNTTSILAGMALAIATSAPASMQAAQVFAMVTVATVLCALVFLLLGIFQLGSAVRFVPYPVIGGFLASTGWLIALGAFRVVAELPPYDELGPGLIAYFQQPDVLVTVALAAVYLIVLRRWRQPAVLPLVLLASALAVLSGLTLWGFDAERARAEGWLFDVAVEARWMPPWRLPDGQVQWGQIFAQWPDMLAVAAVAVITLLLSSSGLEVMSRRDISFDRELREHGWMNLAVALLGGYLSIVSVSRSAVLLESGARTRWAGLLAGGICLAAIAIAPALLGWVPKPVLAAFLLYLGLSLLRDWVVESRQRLNLADWSLIIVILATTATFGFTLAVLAGILASCLNFALSYSRLGVVQHDLDATGIRSSVQRPRRHREVLSAHGQAIRVLVLRGVIFFGTASTVLDRVRGFLTTPPGTTQRVLVLDFTHVDSADSSAALTFTKIAQLAEANHVQLVVSGLGQRTADALAQAGTSVVTRPTLDVALDEAEENLLQSQSLDPLVSDETFAQWMTRELGSPAHWEQLRVHLQRHQLPSGEVLMRQGASSDDGLYLIEYGRLAVTLEGQHRGRRLASLMAGTMVGEMALYDSGPRSATVSAERDSVVWSLGREGLERLHAASPETAMRVHALVVRTMAERMRLANAAIAALQRGA